MKPIVNSLTQILHGLQIHRDEVNTVLVDLQRAVDGLQRLGVSLDIPIPETQPTKTKITTKPKRRSPGGELPVPTELPAQVPAYIAEWMTKPRGIRSRNSRTRKQLLREIAARYNMDPNRMNQEILLWLRGGRNSLYHRFIGSPPTKGERKSVLAIATPATPATNGVAAEEATATATATETEIPSVVHAWAKFRPNFKRWGKYREGTIQRLAAKHGTDPEQAKALIEKWFASPGRTSQYYKALRSKLPVVHLQ